MKSKLPISNIFAHKINKKRQSDLIGQVQDKAVLIFCHTDLGEAELDLLSNILGAIQYDLSKDALIVSLEDQEQIHLAPLLAESIQLVVVFGCSPAQLQTHISDQKYKAQHLLSRKFIFSDHLTALLENKSLKMALWNALKS